MHWGDLNGPQRPTFKKNGLNLDAECTDFLRLSLLDYPLQNCTFYLRQLMRCPRFSVRINKRPFKASVPMKRDFRRCNLPLEVEHSKWLYGDQLFDTIRCKVGQRRYLKFKHIGGIIANESFQCWKAAERSLLKGCRSWSKRIPFNSLWSYLIAQTT